MNSTISATLAACAALAASALFAEAKWEYDAVKKTLTGVATEGETATVFNLSDAGVLSLNTAGTQATIDLRQAAMPDGAPAIVEMAQIRNCKSMTALFLPESVVKLADSLCTGLSALKEVTFPSEPKFTRIPSSAFQKTVLVDVTVPEGVTVIGDCAFKECKSLEHVKLPETLEVLGKEAFSSTTAMKLVEPCIPGSVTNLGSLVFANSTMTNDVEVGFGTDPDTGEPRWVTFVVEGYNRNRAFIGCNGVQRLAFGPGVRECPTVHYERSKLESLGVVEFGPNVTTFSDNYYSCSKLTNMVFRGTSSSPDFVFRDFELGWGVNGYSSIFHPLPSGLREITWERWFAYTRADGNPFENCGDRNLRFLVPGANLKWAAFIADTSKVTPWSGVSETDKAYYYTRYGSDAQDPVGLTVAVGGGLKRTWILTDGKSPSGCLLSMGECRSEFADVTVSPKPGEDGTYAAGTTVAVTFAPKEGVTFTGWTGDVAEGDCDKATITVEMTGMKTLKPTFASEFLVYDQEAKEITDGSWVMRAEGSPDAITVRSFMRALAASGAVPVDLARPVRCGSAAGRIIALSGYVGNAMVSELTLPDTLESIGGMSRDSQSCDVAKISPFLPDGVTNVAVSAFHKQAALTGDLRIGFATDADGNVLETVLNSSCLDCMQKMGPRLVIGPGVKRVAYNAFSENGNAFGSNYSGAFEITVGVNVVKGVGGSMHNVGKSEGSRGVAQNPVTVRYEGDMFDGSSGMFLGIGRSGYDSATDGPKAWNGSAPAQYGMRFYVGADGCAAWHEFLKDATKVTPWASLSDDVKAEYWKLFPKGEAFGTKHPYGLTTDAAVMTNDFPKAYGLPAKQWVFSLRQPGFTVIIR